MSPKMKNALADISAAGIEGALRRNWHGATVAALLRSGAIETVPGTTDMVRVPVVAMVAHNVLGGNDWTDGLIATLDELISEAAAETGIYEDATCEGCGREIHRWREYGSSLPGPWTHGKGRHRQTGCAGLYTYARPVKVTVTEVSKPWDEEIISGTEALLSVLASLTPEEESYITAGGARDLSARKSERVSVAVACESCGVSPHDLDCAVGIQVDRDQATAMIGKRIRIMGDRTASPATALVIGRHETTHGDQYVDLDFGNGRQDAALASHVITIPSEPSWVAKGTKRKIDKGRKLAQKKGK